jgi:membrane-associated phospholipid phosphatase
MAALTMIAIVWLDRPIALWADAHRQHIPDLAYGAVRAPGGDPGRELMFLEQYGQAVCSVVVIAAVAFLDEAGRRRALALALGCLLTLALTHLLKDLCGRSRPFVFSDDGSWQFAGPAKGFTAGSKWGSFPSAHTTAAFALSTGLSWCYPRARAFFMTLALMTAALRVLHTAHYLSDTLAGLAIGVFVMRSTLAARLAGRLIALAPPAAQKWWLA